MLHECVVEANHGPLRHEFVKHGIDIYTCAVCGCIMADVDFVHEQYENDDYYTMAFKTKAEAEAHWGFRWRHILRTLQRYTPLGVRLLDVGAGNGYFVHLASTEFGMRAEGVEISQAEVAYARRMFGVSLKRTELRDITLQYDVVTSFNVIEHVTAPGALLDEMSQKLRAGGYLALTTPSPACIHRRVKGLQQWGMVHPPHHINLFTREALTKLVERAGFEVVEYSTISTYINFVRKHDTNGLLLRRALFQLLRWTGLGADHFLLCRKSEV
jgi:2-polyprenyl-3-methyl-5-hydroxy-6-metoxy-1,4-benzoquinol methylase